jgi:rod shape-determining protein MreC
VQDKVGQVKSIKIPFRIFSPRLSLIIMTVISIALLLLGRSETYIFDEARTKVAGAVAPIMELLSSPIAAARSWIGDFEGHFNVYEQNRRLREENSRLLAWKSAALQLEQTAARYEALLNVQLEPSIGYITGRIIVDAEGPFVHTFIVNAGTEDGAQKGQAVVDTDGLIGRVVGAGKGASRILLISDLNSRIPILVEPGQYRAIMAGDNTREPLLLYLPKKAEIRTGQRVVTSGHGGLFPPGLPVGEVMEGPGSKFRVKPFAERARINFVRLLQFDFPKNVTLEADSVEAQAPASTADGGTGAQLGLLTPAQEKSEQ